jgi:hypothetical protein
MRPPSVRPTPRPTHPTRGLTQAKILGFPTPRGESSRVSYPPVTPAGRAPPQKAAPAPSPTSPPPPSGSTGGRKFGTVATMWLSSFEVQGFKNLVAPVRLDRLEPINVLHGANNVGKSNLLHAIGVLFRLLLGVQGHDWRTGRNGIQCKAEYLTQFGIALADLFNYAATHPIRLAASLAIEEEELALAGIRPRLDFKQITIAMSLESLGQLFRFRVLSFQFADGTDVTAAPPDPERDAFATSIASLVAMRGLGPRGLPHVDVDRRMDAAVDALYDASASTDRKQAMQWDRFVEVMAAFRDVLGDGRFLAVLPRGAPHADLLYETPTMRVPLHALGSGVQQIVALFGHLLTCGAAIVTVEEPELNLRWTLQERVRDALRGLVGKEGAPSQVFLTSHSGAFETAETFYLMQRGPEGPSVERRPVSELPALLGGGVTDSSVAAPRAPAYVSSEGTLRLPDRIRKAIGVEQGGGVSFVDKGEAVVEMMSDDTFLKRAGVDGDDA